MSGCSCPSCLLQPWAQPSTTMVRAGCVDSGNASALGSLGRSRGVCKDKGLNEIMELDKAGMFLGAGISVSC